MKETFDSVWGSVKDRFTNPFLGTFLFVWIVRNWYLVYGLFIFDKECTMDDKLNYVKDYFKDYDILIEFLKNTGASLLLLVIVYVLLIGSQAILQSYHLIINKVNARFDKIPVESKEHYFKLNTEFKNISNNYKELYATNDKNITEIGVLENDVLKLKNEVMQSNRDYYIYVAIFIKSYVKDCVLNKNNIFTNDSLRYNNLFGYSNQIPYYVLQDALYDAILELENDNLNIYLEYLYRKNILDNMSHTISHVQIQNNKERYEYLSKQIKLLDPYIGEEMTKTLIKTRLIEGKDNEISSLGIYVSELLFKN